jgi:hypothetical protein
MITERKQSSEKVSPLPVYEAVSLSPEYQTVAPIAVDLAERAMALAGIMKYLNKANQTAGSRKVQETGGGRFRQSYGAASAEVQKGAEQNRDMLLGKFRQGLRTLSAVEALRANGYDEEDVETQRMKMQIEINKEFGVGKANAAKRNTVAKKAVKSAEKITGRKIET